jgi:predicted hydrocarbon binding protein
MATKKATTKKSAKKVSPKIQAVRNANERCGLITTFCTTMQVMFALGEKRSYIVEGKVTQAGYDDCFIDELYDIVKAFATYMGFKTVEDYAKFIEERYEKIVYEKDEDGNMKVVAKKDEEYNKVVADNVRNIIRNYQVIVEGKE